MRLMLGRLRRGAVIRPAVLEMASAAISAAGVVLAWGRPTLGLVLWAGLYTVALSAVDIKHHRLPDALTLPAIPISLAAVALTDRFAPETGSVLRSGLAAVTVGAVFALPALLAPRAMGWGDVKLVVTPGILLGYLSWTAVVLGIALAFVLGALVAVIGIAVRRWRLQSAIPFGPFLVVGCWVVLVLPASWEALTP
jgi:leader peptidase (prepilin peptidase)/N-methyltransferase